MLQDVHKLLKETLNTFKIDKINLNVSQNDYNLHAANIKVLGIGSYTHITGENLIRWTQTTERIT